MYLEISPRGAGKTQRLIEHADKFLSENPTLKININTVCENPSKRLKEQLVSKGHDASRILTDQLIRGTTGVKNYFDEIDWIVRNNYRKNTDLFDSNGYYCTSIAFSRTLGEDYVDDLLMRLIKENSGQYVSYFSDVAHNILKNSAIRAGLSAEVLRTEYFNQLFI